MTIDTLRPSRVININSSLGWYALRQNGDRLASISHFHVFLFCRDYAPDATPIDYISIHLRYCLSYITSIITDNEAIIADIRSDFLIGSAPQIHCLRQPITIKGRAPSYRSSNRVLWASRLCRQKDVGKLLEIARLAKEYDFDIWGSGDPEYLSMIEQATNTNSNLRYFGKYTNFAEIDDGSHFAFMYTTLWDGLPNVLIEAAGAGLPIVAPPVGGIAELVTEETGYLVLGNDANGFRAALNKIKADPEGAVAKIASMDCALREQHDIDLYSRDVRNIFFGGWKRHDK